MNNELAAAAMTPLRGRPGEVGADALAEGLLLVRASAIKVVRFQLAMERQDRRVALEAVDDLVLLDRRIEDFLSEIPGATEGRSALERELEQQRQALAREKFTLAAGMAGRIATGRAHNDDRRAAIELEAFIASDGAPAGTPSERELILADALAADEDIRRGGVSSRLLAAGLVLLLALAGLLVLALSRPDLIGGLPLLEGVL